MSEETDDTDEAIDWLLAVKRYGLEVANAMYPCDQGIGD